MEQFIIQIKKNGIVIHETRCNKFRLNRLNKRAVDYAGGCWNGVDTFTVLIKRLNELN